MRSKPLAAVVFAYCALASPQTLSLRDEISPQALELAKADYATMSGPADAPFKPAVGLSRHENEEKLLALAQSEIDAEGDRFTEKSPGANDMKLYYLLRATRETKRAVAAAKVKGKPDDHLLSRAYICDQLTKTTIGFGKLQGWRVFGNGPPCLDLPNNARLQEVNAAQQKLLSDLEADAKK
jgi:hypothetical protein